MADLFRDELLPVDDFPLALYLEAANVALGHKAVALGEPSECPFGGSPVSNEVVKARLEWREASFLATEVGQADAHVEAGVAILRDRLLWLRRDKT